MRLIDADVLINDLEHDIAIDEDILAYVGTDQITRATTQFDKDCKQNAIDLLMSAPTIDIPHGFFLVEAKSPKDAIEKVNCDQLTYLPKGADDETN